MGVAASVDCAVAAKCLMAGPHGYNSHLSQPLTSLANQGHPDRLPLLVHRLRPQKAGEVRRAGTWGREKESRVIQSRDVLPDLLAGQGGLRGCFIFFWPAHQTAHMPPLPTHDGCPQWPCVRFCYCSQCIMCLHKQPCVYVCVDVPTSFVCRFLHPSSSFQFSYDLTAVLPSELLD